MKNRRQFLQLLGLSAIGIAADFDPERLLWKPGKTFFLPTSRMYDPETGISIRFIQQWEALNEAQRALLPELIPQVYYSTSGLMLSKDAFRLATQGFDQRIDQWTVDVLYGTASMKKVQG